MKKIFSLIAGLIIIIGTAAAYAQGEYSLTAEPFDMSGLKSGESIVLQADAANNTDENTDIFVIAGYYEDERLKCCALQCQNVEKQNSKKFSLTMSMPQNIQNGEIKLFMWKNSSSPADKYLLFDGKNLFQNGDFETEDGFYTDWAVVNPVSAAERVSTEDGYSLCYTASDSKNSGIYSKDILPEIRKKGEGRYNISFRIKSEKSAAKMKVRIVSRNADGTYNYVSPTAVLDIGTDWFCYNASTDITKTDSVSSLVLMIETPYTFKSVKYPSQKIYIDAVCINAAGVHRTAAENKRSIYLIGDSICTNYIENTKDQQGWGYYFDDAFNDSVNVYNCARGGWTTESYLRGNKTSVSNPSPIYCGLWEGIADRVHTGDYVLISLGHNDSSKTNYCKTTPQQYKNNLDRMARDITAKGAVPIFRVSIPMVKDEYWKDDTTMKGESQQPISVYGTYMKEVAEKNNAVFININHTVIEKLNKMGKDKARSEYYISDLIHLNSVGAKYVSDKIIEAIKAEPSLGDLKALIK